jgi:hypothetical protein
MLMPHALICRDEYVPEFGNNESTRRNVLDLNGSSVLAAGFTGRWGVGR